MADNDDDGGGDLGRALADLESRLADLDGMADRFAGTLARGLAAAVVQGRALDDVLRSVALGLSSRVLTGALTPITGELASLAGSLAAGLVGAVGGGAAVPFASGGVVASPSYFPLPDGRTALMGEAGAEAILPLARGADGRLGVRSAGGGVAVTFNVTTPDVEGFRRSETQLTAMLARAVGRGRRGL